MTPIILLSIGFAIGTFGTLVGAGGGFLLLPILFHLYPSDPPHRLAAISMAVILLNAGSGSIAYAIQRRIPYRAALLFALAAIPGAYLGSNAVSYIARVPYERILGLVIIALSVVLFVNSLRQNSTSENIFPTNLSPSQLIKGMVASLMIGFFASLLGIGGGVFHVPILIHLLDFPVHQAVAASHFVLAVTALVSTITNTAMGSFDWNSISSIILFAPGVIIGAQAGAKLSSKISGKLIVRTLAFVCCGLGIKLLIQF